MKTNVKAVRLLLAVLAAGALVLSACSDDSDSDSGSSDSGSDGDSGSSDEPADGGTASGDAVTIVDFAFEPGDVTVAAGTTVTFTNEDGATHTATGDDDVFDTGELDEGATADVTFDEAGEFAYFCNIHNYMTGTVTVE
jgi:plastocyanin